MKKIENYFNVPHNVLEDAKFLALPLSAQMLFVHQCRLQNRMKRERFFRSVETLALDTGMHLSTVKRGKRALLKGEWIGIERHHFTASGHRAADVFHLNGFREKSKN